MKRLISDKELAAYVAGTLSAEDIAAIHSKAAANGEADLLLHLQLARLEYDRELADELLGPDNFEISERLIPDSLAAAKIMPDSDSDKK